MPLFILAGLVLHKNLVDAQSIENPVFQMLKTKVRDRQVHLEIETSMSETLSHSVEHSVVINRAHQYLQEIALVQT